MKKSITIISLVVGFLLLAYFIHRLGVGTLFHIFQNANLFYLVLYFALTILCYVFLTLRWQIILKAHKEVVGFWILFKATLAGFAVSYITPSARLGGEPVRVYMLNKHSRTDIKRAFSSVIIDKFLELFSVAVFGIVGLGLFFYYPTTLELKIFIGSLILIIILVMSILYFRTVAGRGSISTVMRLLRFKKEKIHAARKVEKEMNGFFINNTREFKQTIWVSLFYMMTMVLEMKVVMLALGADVPFLFAILVLVVLGATNFVPVPGSLGVFEAGEIGLFHFIAANASLGFATSLVIRANSLVLVVAGLVILFLFSKKHILDKK